MYPPPEIIFDLMMCFFTFEAGAAPELIDIQQISKRADFQEITSKNRTLLQGLSGHRLITQNSILRNKQLNVCVEAVGEDKRTDNMNYFCFQDNISLLSPRVS